MLNNTPLSSGAWHSSVGCSREYRDRYFREPVALDTCRCNRCEPNEVAALPCRCAFCGRTHANERHRSESAALPCKRVQCARTHACVRTCMSTCDLGRCAHDACVDAMRSTHSARLPLPPRHRPWRHPMLAHATARPESSPKDVGVGWACVWAELASSWQIRGRLLTTRPQSSDAAAHRPIQMSLSTGPAPALNRPRSDCMFRPGGGNLSSPGRNTQLGRGRVSSRGLLAWPAAFRSD